VPFLARSPGERLFRFCKGGRLYKMLYLALDRAKVVLPAACAASTFSATRTARGCIAIVDSTRADLPGLGGGRIRTRPFVTAHHGQRRGPAGSLLPVPTTKSRALKRL